SAAAIAVSLLVSFTLTPMLAARWLKREEKRVVGDEPPTLADEPAHDSSRNSRFYRWLDRTYTRMLEWSMAHRLVVLLVCALVVASIWPL
ncbi:efflux RND transporter permease subunit, partial [Klebsiella pneumoniae]|nr:efflux RND transporter permease subunit [Klebsiella pneumoniae]